MHDPDMCLSVFFEYIFKCYFSIKHWRCRAVTEVCVALTPFLIICVLFPGHKFVKELQECRSVLYKLV